MSITTTDKSLELALKAVEVSIEKKAFNPVILKLQEISIITDFFIIVTGYSATQNRAIADAIEIALKEYGLKFKREGYEDARWILMDYLDIVIHIFREEEREFYNLEALWGDATKIDITDIYHPGVE
ncbi:MAG TPA: ribosome silencing factor [Candidatus Eremiobacteraeota bacterium]|nr:MAG: Ribosomal silencing factor RsfS [bacterium ADurb.Bin363]HPZ08580.1 ribosome silencing factor [Candidatus Eremiobacteraeota bacterium]